MRPLNLYLSLDWRIVCNNKRKYINSCENWLKYIFQWSNKSPFDICCCFVDCGEFHWDNPASLCVQTLLYLPFSPNSSDTRIYARLHLLLLAISIFHWMSFILVPMSLIQSNNVDSFCFFVHHCKPFISRKLKSRNSRATFRIHLREFVLLNNEKTYFLTKLQWLSSNDIHLSDFFLHPNIMAVHRHNAPVTLDNPQSTVSIR